MSVELTASTELVDAIGHDQFAAHLALFGATITGQRLSFFGTKTVYALKIPDAPEGAATVTPTFHRHGSGDNATVSVLSLDYRDAAGRTIHPQPATVTDGR